MQSRNRLLSTFCSLIAVDLVVAVESAVHTRILRHCPLNTRQQQKRVQPNRTSSRLQQKSYLTASPASSRGQESLDCRKCGSLALADPAKPSSMPIHV